MAALPRQLSLFGPSRARAGVAPATRVPEPAHPVQLEPAPPNVLADPIDPNPFTEERKLPTKSEVFPRAETIAFWLSKQLGVAVRLAITDNRSTMVSFRRAPKTLQLRLHHMFLEAPEKVLHAVADFTWRGKREAGPMLDEFIRHQQERIRLERTLEENELQTCGTHFDLAALFDKVNREQFDGQIRARIGWGRSGPKRRKKSIRLGVYDHQTREIRIHPSLDRPDIPRFFVEFIVFHEMLHQLFPSSNGPGRKVHHPKAFRARERAFPLYGAAIRWEKENLSALLRG